MRSPRLMVISTVLNWLAFVAALTFQITWPWDAYYTEVNPNFLVIAIMLLFITAMLQTVFLVRNMRITFPPANAEQSTEKAKRDSHSRAARLVDTLDDDERAQLLDWMLAQQEEDQRHTRQSSGLPRHTA